MARRIDFMNCSFFKFVSLKSFWLNHKESSLIASTIQNHGLTLTCPWITPSWYNKSQPPCRFVGTIEQCQHDVSKTVCWRKMIQSSSFFVMWGLVISLIRFLPRYPRLYCWSPTRFQTRKIDMCLISAPWTNQHKRGCPSETLLASLQFYYHFLRLTTETTNTSRNRTSYETIAISFSLEWSSSTAQCEK